jgi:RNA polymerase sigma-70 factor (ECF subfamily)
MRDRTIAEDVTSEVFHKALANLPNYEWRGVPFAAWLFRIAANAIIDYAKRAAREFPASDDPPEPAAPDLQASELRAIEHRAQLFRLVGKLPEVQKQVVYERFVEQRSILEIAQRLGKTAGAIKQLQLRAVQNLRAWMEGSRG